ncbi:MmcB family DNA repair protein [Bacillus sp. CB102A.1]
MITGRDELSLEIIRKLNDKKIRVKDIPQKYDVSLDQAKRLSRYLKMILSANKYLSELANRKIQLLGLKVLAINDLFKNEDWEGLEEILSLVTENTTRDHLKQMILALEEKRNRLQEVQKEINFKIKYLDERKKEIKGNLEKLESVQGEIAALTVGFQKYDKETRGFLLEHVGVYRHICEEHIQKTNNLILIKRLDSLFQKKLKAMGIITYNELKYVHEINDLDKFVSAYLERKKNNGGIVWEYEKEEKREINKGYFSSLTPYYKNGIRLIDKTLLETIEQTKAELKRAENQMQDIEKEIQELRKTNVNSFFEAVKISNMLSVKEIQKHGELQDKVGKWLYSKGYVVAFEVILFNGKRVDVAAFNDMNEIVFVEVKASEQDFQSDKKWKEYLPFCDKFYFFGDWLSLPDCIGDKADAGFLRKQKNTLEIHCETVMEHSVINREAIIFSIARAISKKSVYGY